MRYSGGVYDIRKKCYSSFSGDMCPNSIVYVMSELILLVNFCYLTHFEFSNTKTFSFFNEGKVMNPKMPL